jgi:cobalamin biosynthesis protein CbiM
MHIPDAYLSPATHAVTAGVMLPLWTLAVRRSANALSARQVPLLSLGAAFCFTIQMFNVPAVGGTTAHAVGATLLAILLGPWAALLAVTLTLAVQAIFFGDGGILALGSTNTAEGRSNVAEVSRETSRVSVAISLIAEKWRFAHARRRRSGSTEMASAI